MLSDPSPAVRAMLSIHDNSPTPSIHPDVPNFPSSPQEYATIHALCDAPFLPTYPFSTTHLISGEEFFEENPLISATLKPQTQQKYSIALANFTQAASSFDHLPLSLDQTLMVYIQPRFLRDSRPGQRQEMANLICILILMYPTLHDKFGLSRRCLSGWKSLKPSRAAAPLTTQTTLAFTWKLLSDGHPHSAAGLLLTAHFQWWSNSIGGIESYWGHVALPGDTRLSSYEPGVAGFNIKDAKTARYSGKLQLVKLSNPYAISFLQALHSLPHSDSGKVAKASYQTYTNHLKQAATYFGFPSHVFTTHSARIGKATEGYLQGAQPATIAINGRWQSLSSLRYYLRNGKAWVLQNNVSQEHQAAIKRAADSFATLLATSSSEQLAV